ncbi:extracellular solute-binding protein [Micromonospora foliorum]|uniref:extracellular solute-binding protein n=1 Tax=Micromonospora foliorum TaxID=2911210 RepID=UPI001EE94AD4|nr:extracellular solute-binding protein [Micromonospora foliorum]MCG5438992.1 extracellular solute-binding protein [Micromonospora foliorum]
MRTDAEPISIDIWLPSYPAVPDYVGGIRALAASFHDAHPDYRIRVRESSYKTLPADVDAAARRGAAPALVQYFHTSTQLARDMRDVHGAPLFRPVATTLAERTTVLGEPVVTDDIVAPARGYYSADGLLLAAPPLVSTTLLYANTTLLAAAGVTALPTTWAEVTAACKAVSAHTGGPAITWPNHGWIFQQAVAQQGGLLADHANGRDGRAEKVDLAVPEMVAFAQWWRGLYRDGHYHYTGGQAYGENTGRAWQENFAAFAEQRVAFVLSSSVEAEWLIQAGRDHGFTVEVGRMPHNGEVRYAGNIVGGDAIWLTDSVQPAVRDGALAFLQHLLNPRAVAERHKATWFIPVTTTAIDLLAGDGWFDERPHQRVAIEQLLATDGSPAARGAVLGEFPRIQGLMTHAMEDILLHDADPSGRFARASEQAQRLLDDYNADCLGLRAGPPGPRQFVVD